jgi:polar amino acid transport system substrate-binding protein
MSFMWPDKLMIRFNSALAKTGISDLKPTHRRKGCWLIRFVLACTASIFLFGCTLSPAPTNTPLPGKLGEILRRGTLIIATDPEYPPQSELLADVPRLEKTGCASNEYTANQLRGSDIDIAVEIANRLGVEPCFVVPPWSQIVGGSWNDRWDLSIGSMAITSERMEVLYFTQPYTTGAAVLFVHKDNQTYTKPADLSGKRIGVCAGCAYESYLNRTLVIPGVQMEYLIQDATAVGFDTDITALASLAKGDGLELDAVLTDPDTGKQAIAESMPLKQLGEPVYRDYVAAAIDKKSSADPLPLVRKITEIILQMHKDGFLSALSLKYYAGDFAAPASQFDINALGQYTYP